MFGETDVENPFVPTEQMMPFLPFVRCRDADEAIALAHESEQGFRHTAIIHSHDVVNMTRMVKAVDTTAAGDAFNGALALSLAKGQALDDAIGFANAVAAFSVTRMGAQASLPTWDEIESFLR